MRSESQAAGKRVCLAALVFFLSIAIGVIQYRGPAPLAADAPADRPSATRMRQTLVDLLGDPVGKHTTGSEAGEAFLQRLESKIRSFGLQTRRIEIPWNHENQNRHPKGRVDLLPPDTVLKNLLVTVPGSDPSLAPILVATHHDSCRWGPGAGDAGSAVVALIEHCRMLSTRQPNRTTLYLFTDGEEFGLLGAYAIAAQDPLPFPVPVFVLNFDARGTSGGVPMFETHRDNGAWIEKLIGHLATPKITSSLAVTVYRSLPNATDFTVFGGQLGWPGFNYATIGGAHHYHQPSDRPENLSDRTLQHMGDQLNAMHAAIDALDSREIAALKTARPGENAVFFDVFGIWVVHFSENVQKVLGIIAAMLVAFCWFGRPMKNRGRGIARHALGVGLAIAGGFGIGWGVKLFLKTTPWSNLRYTPVDYPLGLTVVVIAFLLATLILERTGKKTFVGDREFLCDWTWMLTAVLGAYLAFVLPGGAYLLVLPSMAYGVVRVLSRQAVAAAWTGWITMVVLVGPLLTLLVQALGPWQQPMYAILASLLAVLAMTVWFKGEGVVEAESHS